MRMRGGHFRPPSGAKPPSRTGSLNFSQGRSFEVLFKSVRKVNSQVKGNAAQARRVLQAGVGCGGRPWVRITPFVIAGRTRTGKSPSRSRGDGCSPRPGPVRAEGCAVLGVSRARTGGSRGRLTSGPRPLSSAGPAGPLLPWVGPGSFSGRVYLHRGNCPKWPLREELVAKGACAAIRCCWKAEPRAPPTSCLGLSQPAAPRSAPPPRRTHARPARHEPGRARRGRRRLTAEQRGGRRRR